MYISPYTAVDAALAASAKANTDRAALTHADDRATVIDLLSHSQNDNKAQRKNETDQIFILGYN
ncbi:hypothetical protein [Pseudoalteromonas mariniglutinosa]|uniref:hypothetical protein n=1 Tax=Pseudoalteromonas mariniglutinosa TaxID=206042 RepID=UPI00384D357C